jgi:hypothetical protein
MNNLLEVEIIEKFRQLPPESRVRVLTTLQEEVAQKQLSLVQWLQDLDQLQISRAPDSTGRVQSASEWVNEVREERDADILHSIGFGDTSSNHSD